MHFRRLYLSMLLSLIGISLGQTGAIADESATAKDSKPPSLKTEVEQLKVEDRLEGHIKAVAEASSANLKELLSSLGHLKRTSYDLFCEVQREDLVVVGEPNVIGPMIIPAVPDVSGMVRSGQYLPARKKWVDYYMSQVEKLYPMVTKELEALKLPDDLSDDGKTHYKNVVQSYNKLGPTLKNLESVTQGPAYDNKEIADCSAVAQKYLAEMDKEIKRLYREIKKESSRSEHKARSIEKQIEKDERKLEKDGQKNSASE